MHSPLTSLSQVLLGREKKTLSVKVATIKFGLHAPSLRQPPYCRTNSFIPYTATRSVKYTPLTRKLNQALRPANPSSQDFPHRRSVSARASRLFLPNTRDRVCTFTPTPKNYAMRSCTTLSKNNLSKGGRYTLMEKRYTDDQKQQMEFIKTWNQ